MTPVEANLITAYVAASTYYVANNRSYLGLDFSGSSSVSTISQIDAGLSYVSGTASGDFHAIAVAVPSAHGLILAAFSGTRRCYYIVNNTTPDAAGVADGTSGVGTWYGYVATSAPSCTTSRASRVAAPPGRGHFIKTGFPS